MESDVLPKRGRPAIKYLTVYGRKEKIYKKITWYKYGNSRKKWFNPSLEIQEVNVPRIKINAPRNFKKLIQKWNRTSNVQDRTKKDA